MASRIMHLVQDLVYCRFAYEEHHWNPTLPGNVDRLHNDYALLDEMEYTWSSKLRRGKSGRKEDV